MSRVLESAAQLLQQGRPVTLKATGHSMHPFINEGQSLEIKPLRDTPRVGDITFARVNGRYYCLHRIVAINGNQVTLHGDGNCGAMEKCLIEDLFGYLPQSRNQRRLGQLWRILRPIRRPLLIIYRQFKRR